MFDWGISLVVVVIQLLSCVPHFSTPYTVAHQASLFMGFPRQESWSGLPFPSLGDLPAKIIVINITTHLPSKVVNNNIFY